MSEEKQGKETENASNRILTPERLLQLHEHYTSELRENLEFAYKYLNFYVGLNSALLAATIAGLLKLAQGDRKALLLLFGPLLVVSLSVIGLLTVRVFYRRHIEAWVTSLNIEKMLGKGESTPRFRSESDGGFVTQFERKMIRKRLNKARDEDWTAEYLVKRITRVGDTLIFAGLTFFLFFVAGIILGIVACKLAHVIT